MTAGHPMQGNKCNRVGCKQPARYRLTLLLYPPAIYQDAPPIEVHLMLVVCEHHSKTLTLSQCVSDDGWERLLADLHTAGEMRPERERTVLKFHDFGTDPIRCNILRVENGYRVKCSG